MWTTLQDKIVEVRKPHQCFGCLIQIELGAKARYIYSVNDHWGGGGMYLCLECEEYQKAHPSVWGEYSDDEVMEGFISDHRSES